MLHVKSNGPWLDRGGADADHDHAATRHGWRLGSGLGTTVLHRNQYGAAIRPARLDLRPDRRCTRASGSAGADRPARPGRYVCRYAGATATVAVHHIALVRHRMDLCSYSVFGSKMSERWLPIPGYESLYWVSDRGRVRSTRKILKPELLSGYHRVTLWRGVARHVWNDSSSLSRPDQNQQQSRQPVVGNAAHQWTRHGSSRHQQAGHQEPLCKTD
jgi:hypothetical protein